MKAYKGFDKDLKCRGFQYEVGKTYETDKADLCRAGFHVCEDPLDVFSYYPPTDGRYCEVELEDVSDEKSSDSKRVGKKITIGAEIGVRGLVKAHVEWIKAQCETEESGGDGAKQIGGDEANQVGGNEANQVGGDEAKQIGGDWANQVGGENSIMLAGDGGKFKAGLGSLVVHYVRGAKGAVKEFKAAIVDGETIKADTWYTLKDGEFVEVPDEQ